jgi:hypothetical protein
MYLTKKLTKREIQKGFISLSNKLLGTFYPLFSKEQILNAQNSRIENPQTFHFNLPDSPQIKKLRLRIQGGIVVELALNNIMQRMDLIVDDALIIEKINEDEYSITAVKASDLSNYGKLNFDDKNYYLSNQNPLN